MVPKVTTIRISFCSGTVLNAMCRHLTFELVLLLQATIHQYRHAECFMHANVPKRFMRTTLYDDFPVISLRSD
jgi:hypothetical protein